MTLVEAIPTVRHATMRRLAQRSLWRVRQFVALVRHRHDDALDARVLQALPDARFWPLLERLPAFDRAHHLRVYDTLVQWGQTNPDVLLAALLHDVGKADHRGRAHGIHRTIRVLLQRLAPGLLTRLTQPDHPRIVHGLYLAVHHARLGADAAAGAGAPSRCCALIALHERRLPTGDGELDALIAADGAAIV